AVAAPSAGCNKGWLWPFVRDSGDCQTEVERKSVGNSPYSCSPATPVSVTPTQMSAVQPGNQPNPPTVAAPANAPSSSPVSAPASCTKGLLWPFVRGAGDCPSDAQ